MKTLTLFVLFLAGMHVRADSVFLASQPEMVANADFIAIVEFQKAERGVYKGLGGYPNQKERIVKRFSRRVSARVIETLKGKLPNEIKIHDSLGHWDALFQDHHDQSKSNSGRYLIFLRGDLDFLTGANGWASTSRIVEGKMEWVERPDSPEFRIVNLREILERIRKQIETNPMSNKSEMATPRKPSD